MVAQIDIILFAFLNILAWGLMLYGTRVGLELSGAMHIISMGLFFILGLIMIGSDVGIYTEPMGFELVYNSTGDLQTNTTETGMNRTIISNAQMGLPFLWFYLAMGSVSLLLFFFNWRGMLDKSNAGKYN